MAKSNTDKKILALLLITCFFVSESQSLIWLFTHKMRCYHYRECINGANWIWMHLAPYWGPRTRLYYAKFMSRWMRLRMRRFLSHIIIPTFGYFIPIRAFKRYPPTATYHRDLKRRYGGRSLESIELGDDRMLEEGPLELSLRERFENSNDLDEIKTLACKAVKHDSEINKGGFEIIKFYYTMVLRAKYHEKTGELRSLKYFDLSCFVNPHNQRQPEYDNMTPIEKLSFEEDEEQTMEMLMQEFDPTTTGKIMEFQDLKEIEDDGSTWDGQSSPKSDSLPVADDDEIEEIVQKDDFLRLAENAF